MLSLLLLVLNSELNHYTTIKTELCEGKREKGCNYSSALYIQQFIRCIYKCLQNQVLQVPYIIAKWQGQKRHLHLFASKPSTANKPNQTTIHLET